MIFRTFVLIISLINVSIAAIPRVESTALTMVPKGRVLFRNLREMTVKTEAGTKIKVEFERLGLLQEASGLNLNRGDEFEPGQGLLSLSSAAQAVARAGHQVKGEWNLERDKQYGWVYELASDDQDKKVFHLVNAKTGKIINSIDVPSDEQGSPRPSKTLHQAEVSL